MRSLLIPLKQVGEILIERLSAGQADVFVVANPRQQLARFKFTASLPRDCMFEDRIAVRADLLADAAAYEADEGHWSSGKQTFSLD
jgi:hypothetical protein